MYQPSTNLTYKKQKLREKTKKKIALSVRYLIKNQKKFSQIEKSIKDYQGHQPLQINIDSPNQRVSKTIRQCFQQVQRVYNRETVQDIEIKKLQKQIEMLEFYGKICDLDLLEKKILQAIIWPTDNPLKWGDIYKLTNHIIKWSIHLKKFQEYFSGNSKDATPLQLQEVYNELKKPIDSGKLWIYLNKKQVKYQKYKLIVLLIGRTGVGKTTFIKSMLGYRHRGKHDPQDDVYTLQTTKPLKEEHKQLLAKTSTESVTSNINVVKLQSGQIDNQIFLVDCPGLNDTRGREVQIANNYLREVFLKSCQKIIVIQMVKINDLLTDRVNNLKYYAQYLKKQYIFNDQKELANHLIILYNCSDSEQASQLKSLIEQQLQYENDTKLIIAYKFMKSQVNQPCYHIRKKNLGPQIDEQQDFQQMQCIEILKVLKTKIYVEISMLIKNFIRSQEHNNLLQTIKLQKEKMQYYLNLKKIKEAKHQLMIMRLLFKFFRDHQLLLTYDRRFIDILKGFYLEAVTNLQIEDKNQCFTQEQFQLIKKSNFLIKDIRLTCQEEFRDLKEKYEQYERTANVFLKTLSDLLINKDKLDQNEIIYLKKYSSELQNDTFKHFIQNCIKRLQEKKFQIERAINFLTVCIDFKDKFDQIQRLIQNLYQDETTVNNISNHMLPNNFSIGCSEKLGLKVKMLAKTMVKDSLTHISQYVLSAIKDFQQYYYNSFEQKFIQVLESFTIFRKVIPNHNNVMEFIDIKELDQAIVGFFKKINDLYQQFLKFIQKLQSNKYDLAKAKVITVNFKKDMNQIFKFDLIDLYPPQLVQIKEDISQKCQTKYNRINELSTMILNLIKNKGIQLDFQEIKKQLEQVAKFFKCRDFYRYYLQKNQNDDFQMQLENSLIQKYGFLDQQQQSLKNINKLLSFQIQINNIVQVIAKTNVNNQIISKLQQLQAIVIKKITNVKVFSTERLTKYRNQLKVLSQQINPEEMANTFRYISEIIKKDQRHHTNQAILILKSELQKQFTDFWDFFQQNLQSIKFGSIFDSDTFSQFQITKQTGFLCNIIKIFDKLKSVQLISSNKNYDVNSIPQIIQKIIKSISHKFTILNAQFQEEKIRCNKSKNFSDLLKKIIKKLRVFDEISYNMEKYFQEIAHAQGGICQTITKIREQIRKSIQDQSLNKQTQIQGLFKDFINTEFSESRFHSLWNKTRKTQKRVFFVKELESYIDHLIKKNIKQRRLNRITEEDSLSLQNVLKNTEDINDVSKTVIEKLKSQLWQQRTKIENKLEELLNQIKSLTEQYQFQKAHELCNKALKYKDLLQGFKICEKLNDQKTKIMDYQKKIKKIFEQKTGEQSIRPDKILQIDLKIHIYLISKKPHFANKIRLNFKKQVQLLINRLGSQQIPPSEFKKLVKIYQKFLEYSKHAFDGLRISQFFTIKQTLQKNLQAKSSQYLNIFLKQLTTLNNHSQRQDFLTMGNNFEILQLSQLYPRLPENNRIKDLIKKIYYESMIQMIDWPNFQQKIRMIQQIKASIQKINNKQLPLIRDVTKEIKEKCQKHYQQTVLNVINEMIQDFEKKYVDKFKLSIIKDFLVQRKEQFKDVYHQLRSHLKDYSFICNQYLLVQKFLQCLPQEYMNLGSRIQHEFRICYNYQKLKEIIQNIYQSTPKEQKIRTQMFISQVKRGLQKVQRLNFEGKQLLYIKRDIFINIKSQERYVLSLKKDYLLLKVIYKKINQYSPLHIHFKQTDLLTKFITLLFNKIKFQAENIAKQMQAIIFSDDNKQIKQRKVCLVPYFQIKRNLLNLFIQNFKQLNNKQALFFQEASNKQKQFINKKLTEGQLLQQIYLMKKLSIFKVQLTIEKQSEIKSHLKKEQIVEAIKKNYNKQKKEQRKFILNKIISQNSSFEYHTANIIRFVSYQQNRMDDIQIHFFKQYVWSLGELVKKSPTLEIFSLKKYYEQKCGTYSEISIILSIFSYIFPEILFYENNFFVTYLLQIYKKNDHFKLQQLQKVILKISNSQKQTLKMFISLYYILNNYDVYMMYDQHSMFIQNNQRISIFISKNTEKQQIFQLFKDFQTFLSKRKQILRQRKSQKQQRRSIIVVQAQRILNLLLDNHTKNKKDQNIKILEHLQDFQLYTCVSITPYNIIYEPIKTIYPEIRICQKQTTKKQNYQFSVELTKDMQYLPVVRHILASKTKKNSNLIVCFENSDQLQLFLAQNSNQLAQHYQSFVIIDDKQDQTYVRELKFQTMDIFVNILLITKEMFLRLKKSNDLSINQKEIQFILAYVPEFSINLNEIRSILNSISSKLTFKIAINMQKEKQINIKKGQNKEVSTLNQQILLKQKNAFNEIFKRFEDLTKTKAKKVQNLYVQK